MNRAARAAARRAAVEVLSDDEARMLSALSQRVGSLAELRRVLGISSWTLDRIIWRNRRVRPATMARFREGLRRAYVGRDLLADAIAEQAIERAIASIGARS